ncbi:MAG: four helix bundle protein [Nitrosomonadaceae bacterium]
MIVKFLKLEDLSAYRKSRDLANCIWKIVSEWDYFNKDAFGKQFVRATDSISANIAEGFGRHFKKEKIHFYHYARGSTLETLDWFNKAKVRNLLVEQQIQYIENVLSEMPKEINNLINYTIDKLGK